MIDTKHIQYREQVFSQKEGNVVYHIAVDRLRNKIKKQPTEMLEIIPDVAKRLLNSAGVEEHRLARVVNIIKTDPHYERNLKPLLICWFKGDRWCLVDGNHTYVAAYMCGLRTFPALVAKRQQWTGFRVSNHEEPDFKGFSGIHLG